MKALGPDPDMKTVILHIGLPKTGSTSLQFLLGENRRKLLRQNADFFLGSLARHRFNHSELYLSVLRDGVTTFAHQKFTFEKEALRTATRGKVRNFVNRSKAKTLLFSAEGLSFLRTEEELRHLRELFPESVRFRIFLVERRAEEWLESWRKQILSKPGRMLSSDTKSTLYVEADTWLTDFALLKDLYRQQFQDLTIFSYRTSGLLLEILAEAGVSVPLDPDGYRYKEVKPGQLARAAPAQRTLSRLERLWNEFDYWWRYERGVKPAETTEHSGRRTQSTSRPQ